MNDTGAKQQIVDKIKNSSNILVTVSADPSVDELSAALGLTLMLNKLNKHATAVFSGAIPPAITFLDPQKTFENTVDSLRDFIIALDKEKADHLRYKVDGDVVKIFITPYRTTITGDDLDFSQGDYNVELVLALGVKNQDNLDSALTAHGRILHDATVATISIGEASDLGNVDWREQTASSLSEVLVGLSDSLKSDKSLLDEQIATAFLTGIVAATDRFSNNRTSSRVMTIAAQLMGAGANQQLIASKLEEAHEIGSDAPSDKDSNSNDENSDGTTDLSEDQPTKVNKKTGSGKKLPKPEEPKKDDGELDISHEKEGTLDEVSQETTAEKQAEAAKLAEEELAKQAHVATPDEAVAAKEAEQKLAEQLAQTAPVAAATPSVADLQADLAAANAEVTQAAAQPPATTNETPSFGATGADAWKDDKGEPAMGGTLNATTEQAAEESRRAAEDDRNRTILSHGGNGYIADSTAPAYQSPLNSSTGPAEEPSVADPFQDVTLPTNNDTAPMSYAAPIQPTETLAQLDEQTRAPHEDARAAINAAFDAAPSAPTTDPLSQPSAFPAPEAGSLPPVGMPPLPPLPDFSTLPPLPPQAAPDSAPSGALPPEKLEDMFKPAPAAPAAPAPTAPDQFKIPGQS